METYRADFGTSSITAIRQMLGRWSRALDIPPGSELASLFKTRKNRKSGAAKAAAAAEQAAAAMATSVAVNALSNASVVIGGWKMCVVLLFVNNLYSPWHLQHIYYCDC